MRVADPEPSAPFARQLAAAGALLADDLGADVRLTAAERLTGEGRRNLLLRCAVDGAPEGGPASVILKQIAAEGYDPDAEDSADTRRFFADWAGAAFLGASVGPSLHAPRLHGGDRALGLVVLEDLGAAPSLVEPLLASDADAAEQALVAFAACLGALHADTIGGAERFEATARAIDRGVADVDATCRRQADELRERAAQLSVDLERLGVPPADLADDVRTIAGVLARPGPFLAYVHGDPCPDNVLFVGGRPRLIDFEFAGYGHALRDGVYGRMQFPTCWCASRVPGAVLGRMEDTYRAALARGCPAAHDDRLYAHELSLLRGYWLISTLAWLLGRAIDEDSTWGIASVRSRLLARLEDFLGAADDRLPALRGAAEALLTTLRRRWPDTPPLPVYPAFRGTAAAAARR